MRLFSESLIEDVIAYKEAGEGAENRTSSRKLGSGMASPPSFSSSPPPLPKKMGKMSKLDHCQLSGELMQQQSSSNFGTNSSNGKSICQQSPDWLELTSTTCRDFKRDVIHKGVSQINQSKRKITGLPNDLQLIGNTMLNGSPRSHDEESSLPLLPSESINEPSCPNSPQTQGVSCLNSCSNSNESQSLTDRLKGLAHKSKNQDQCQVVVLQQPQISTSLTSISRGSQVETEDLIKFSMGSNNNNNEKEPIKLVSEEDMIDVDTNLEEEEEEEEHESSRTADEQMDYLESLENCPCYAKCCIDSVITLFCVTLLG